MISVCLLGNLTGLLVNHRVGVSDRVQFPGNDTELVAFSFHQSRLDLVQHCRMDRKLHRPEVIQEIEDRFERTVDALWCNVLEGLVRTFSQAIRGVSVFRSFRVHHAGDKVNSLGCFQSVNQIRRNSFNRQNREVLTILVFDVGAINLQLVVVVLTN